MKTYVPKRLYDDIISRPDWPEIERDMKKIYGDTWELVPIYFKKEEAEEK